MKVCEKCFNEIDTKDGVNECGRCSGDLIPQKPKKPRAKRRTRKEMDALMASCGMVRVRGALGGTYYE